VVWQSPVPGALTRWGRSVHWIERPADRLTLCGVAVAAYAESDAGKPTCERCTDRWRTLLPPGEPVPPPAFVPRQRSRVRPHVPREPNPRTPRVRWRVCPHCCAPAPLDGQVIGEHELPLGRCPGVGCAPMYGVR